LWTVFIKNYPVCTLENVLYCTIKNFCTYINILCKNYLLSSLNRIENTAHYSINNQEPDQGRERAVQHVQEEWDSLDQRVIDSAIKEWRKRLWACIAADGGHFEHDCFVL